MTGLNEAANKAKDSGSKSMKELYELRELREKQKFEILKNSANGIYRYKSKNDPKRFVKYLESNLDKWEYLSTKGGPGTHYAKMMLIKTNMLIGQMQSM